MDTVKHADAVALEASQTFAGKVKALVPDAVVILYGSAARNEMEEFSDIDIYVEIPDIYDIAKIKPQIDDFAWEAGFYFGKVIQAFVYRKSDVWDTPRRSSPFIKTVHREGIIL